MRDAGMAHAPQRAGGRRPEGLHRVKGGNDGMNMREQITFSRSAEAVMIPSGERVLVPEGATGTITQSLGGAYTIITDRRLMIRISGKDLEAIGKATATDVQTGPVAPITPAAL